MNDYGRRYLIEQLNRHDHRRGNRRDNNMDSRNDNRSSDYNDYNDYDNNRDNRNEMDERRGVKGSGRGRDNRDNRDNPDYSDYNDYSEYDNRVSKIKLTKADMNHWKHAMQNTDGTQGEHYTMQQVMKAADQLGIRFRDYDEREFCVAVNMFYSDYGHVIRKLVPDKDKELMACAEMAKAFFDDPDGPEPSEKLAIVYHCMTDFG